MSKSIVKTKIGRPTKKNPDTITKLMTGFNNGYSVLETCDYAGIAPKNFYEWLKNDEDFRNKIEAAKRMPNRKAKENIIRAIQEGDPNASKYWLDRRDPDFRQKGEIDVNHGVQETRNKIKEFLDDANDDIGGDAQRIEIASGDGAEATDEVAQPPQDIS